MLPGINRWNDAKVLDEAADRLARMALGACDGQTHGNPAYPSWIGYPTRRNTEALVRLVLTPGNEPAPYARGFSLDEFFGAAWERVEADEGDDQAALDLLVAYHAAICGGEPWAYSPAAVDKAVADLVDSGCHVIR